MKTLCTIILSFALVSFSFAQSPIDARKGFQTKLKQKIQDASENFEDIPEDLFSAVKYPTSLGDMQALVSKPKAPGEKHPAIIWITGGFPVGGVGSYAWEPPKRSNDQSARAYREAGIIMMYPTFRGQYGNPGSQERYLGELDDLLAAAEWLRKQPNVDPDQVYLGGHSSGGTLALLGATASDQFKAVIAFGPVADPSAEYDPEDSLHDINDARENRMRAPIHYVNNIRVPTYVIEGQEAYVKPLYELAEVNPKHPFLRISAVVGANHFNVLAPVNELIASHIVSLKPGEPFSLDRAAIQDAFSKEVMGEKGFSVIQGLRSKDPKMILKTLARVQHYDHAFGPILAQAIAPHLYSKDSDVFKEAADTLSDLKPHFEPAWDALADNYPRARGMTMSRLSRAIGKMKPRDVARFFDELAPMIDHDDRMTRQYAISTIGYAKEHASPLMPRLLARLKKETNVQVLYSLADTFADIGEGKEIVGPDLAQRIMDGVIADKYLDHQIAEALGRLGYQDPKLQDFARNHLLKTPPDKIKIGYLLYLLSGEVAEADYPILRAVLGSGRWGLTDKLMDWLLEHPEVAEVFMSDLQSILPYEDLVDRTRFKMIEIVTESDEDLTPSIRWLSRVLIEPAGKGGRKYDNEDRWTAADALGAMGPRASSAVKVLLRALTSDPNIDVRWSSADAIGLIGAAGAPAVPELIKALSHENKDMHVSAARALMRIGEKASAAVPALTAALDHPNDALVIQAAKALGSMGEAAESSIPRLVKLVEEREHPVAWKAAYGLITFDEKAIAAAPVFISWLESKQADVRWTGADALARVLEDPNHEGVVKLVEALEREKYPKVQYAFCTALARLSVADSDGGDALLALYTSSEDAKVKVRAIEALANVREVRPSTLQALRTFFDQDEAYRAPLLSAIGKHGAAARAYAPDIVQWVEHEKPAIRWRAIQALGRIGPDAKDQAAPAMVNALEQGDRNQKWAAIDAVAALGLDGSEFITLLKSLASGDDADLKKAAVAALAHLQPATPSPVPTE